MKTSPHVDAPRTSSDAKQLIGLGKFLRDKIYVILINLSALLVLVLALSALHLPLQIIVLVAVCWLISDVTSCAIEYYRRRKFYSALIHNLAQLDQAYLILETLEEPHFYDGEILQQALYQVNRSMADNVKYYCERSQDFREYVEMWIHEVKTPLATLAVISQDHRVNEQIKHLDDYVEQILYFVRAENVERDYLVNPISLEKIIGDVANRNREILQAKSIDFLARNLNHQVYTDAKWLEFIVNQIINNSIKYGSTVIEVSADVSNQTTNLKIRDNGIGIDSKDLRRVFDKSFTGHNGRQGKQSTGMGLYIAHTLCQKLGHQIRIDSEPHQYTEVTITFANQHYYEVVQGKLTKK